MARVLKWRRCAREQLVRDKEWQRDKERGVAERYRKMIGERCRASEPRQQWQSALFQYIKCDCLLFSPLNPARPPPDTAVTALALNNPSSSSSSRLSSVPPSSLPFYPLVLTDLQSFSLWLFVNPPPSTTSSFE